jgi:TRAP-type transport system periplasmic protein
MTISRRALTGLSAATLGAMAMPNLLRAQSFQGRQYHVQPEGSHLQIYLEKIWSAVREETNGRLSVTVYPRNNGVAAGDPELLQQVQEGGLEFFTLNGNILSRAHPAADIQGIPFAFSSGAQIGALNDGEFGTYLRRELVTRGVQLIPSGAMENGFKQITSAVKPIEKAHDLRGFKMRVPNGKLFIGFYKALGADPKIVNFNRLYEALAEREVDGQENPLVIVEENKLYEVCKYLSLNRLQHAGEPKILAAPAGGYPGRRNPERQEICATAAGVRTGDQWGGGSQAQSPWHDRQRGRSCELPQSSNGERVL